MFFDCNGTQSKGHCFNDHELYSTTKVKNTEQKGNSRNIFVKTLMKWMQQTLAINILFG